MGRLHVDKLAPLIFCFLLMAQWAGADYFAHNSGYMVPSPFSRLWASYDRTQAAQFVIPIVVSLGLALMVPVGRSLTLDGLMDKARDLSASLGDMWLYLGLFAVALMVFVKGPYILSAPEYLMSQGPAALVSLASLMGPLGALSAGALSVKRPIASTFILLAIFVLLFAGATRILCGVPLLFIVGRYVAGAQVTRWELLASTLFAYASLPIPLISRGQAAHGLLHYWQPVLEAILDPNYVSTTAMTFGENVGMTIPLGIHVARLTTITPQDMLISINPLPSTAAGWTDIMQQMRVHEFIPYSALGEWASLGMFQLMAFVFVWTLISRVCVASVSRGRGTLMLPLLVMTVALSSMSVSQLGQYNTRAIARLLDMMILLALGDLFLRWIQPFLPEGLQRLLTIRKTVEPESTHP